MQGKVVVVTGAAGALGGAVARAAKARGAVVVAIDRAPFDAQARAAFDLCLDGVDLTDAASCGRAIDAAHAHARRLDVLLNIAGGFTWQTVEHGAMEAWDAMFAINVKSAAAASQAALPHLIASGDGRIVNVGALGAVKAGAGMGAYAASKAGVAKLTESLAEELKDRGVTVNAVLPSIIDTPANRASMPDADASRWVGPGDLANVILFLASAEARAVTGALVPVAARV